MASTAPVEIDSEKLSEDRKNYYDKWHKFTKDEVEKSKEDDEKEKEVSDQALGISKDTPKSEAEKEDKVKREALKEAKKAWEDKKLSEAAQKFVIEDLTDVERVLDSVKLHWKPVILLRNNKNCKLKIPHNLKHKLVKIFIENCENCQMQFETELITQYIEVSRCNDCHFKIRQTTATLQLDMCNNLTVEYSEGMMDAEKTKIYHAGVSNLFIDTAEGIEHRFSYKDAQEKDTDEATKLADTQAGRVPQEIQYVTQKVGKKIITQRVIRDASNLPSTKEELEASEISARSIIRDAEIKKEAGNEAFKERNYAQAAVFYTEGLDILERAKTAGVETLKENPERDITHILLANRAFCWQKLGHHEKAEEDSRECLKLKPEYCKGLFRLGLALHAQKKYFEAVPILGKAHKLEPKNEQIKQALGFAEMQMRKMMRHDD